MQFIYLNIIIMAVDCLDYAMNYIYRFPKTEKELKVQLLKKKYSEKEIEKTIAYLKSKKFVDDENFATLYIQSELVKKWKAEYLVKWKLLSKWIDKDLLEDVLERLQKDIKSWVLNKIKTEVEKLKLKWIDWIDIIKKLLAKWYKLDDIKKYVEIWQKYKID